VTRPGNTVLAILLLVSVAFNLFAAGALVATRWLNRPLGSAVEAVMRSYPPSVRAEVRSRLFADRDVVRAAFAELGAARKRMFALMRAETLDEKALQGAMAEVREKTATVQALLQAALLASLKDIPAAEREKIEPPRLGLGFGIGRLREDAP
jgi:uncharacterized membrane protein